MSFVLAGETLASSPCPTLADIPIPKEPRSGCFTLRGANRQAWQQGFRACIEGRPESDNDYRFFSQRHQNLISFWDAGWQAGKAAIEEWRQARLSK